MKRRSIQTPARSAARVVREGHLATACAGNRTLELCAALLLHGTIARLRLARRRRKGR